MNTWSGTLGKERNSIPFISISNLECGQRQCLLTKLYGVIIVLCGILLSACNGGSNGSNSSAVVGVSSSSSVSSVGSSSSSSSSSTSSAISTAASSFSSIS